MRSPRTLTLCSLILISFAWSPCVLHAQEKDEAPSIDERSKAILNKCIEAMGGEMALSDFETIELKGKSYPVWTRRGTGAKGSSSVFLKRNMIRSVMTLDNGNKTEWVDTGELSWSIFSEDADHPEIKKIPFTPRETTPWPGVVLEWRNSKKQINFISSGEFEGEKVHTVAFKRSDGALCHYHFSQGTSLLHAVEFKQFGSGLISTAYKIFEYQTVDGIVLPKKQTTTKPNYHSNAYEFEVVKIGGEIPDDYFEMSDDLKQRWKEIQQQDK